MTALTHNYNGFDISQDSDGYTSLTDMAKAAGKLVADYLKIDATQDYLQGLSTDMNIPLSSLVKVFKGGNGVQGTWAHPEVAIDFAKWCNVSFRIWANRTLRGVIEGATPQPRADRHIDTRKIDLQISIKKLEIEIAKLEIERVELYPQSTAVHAPLPCPPAINPPVPQELSLDIEQRYKASQADLLAAKTLENRAKAKALHQKFAPKQTVDIAKLIATDSVAAWANERVVLDPTAKTYVGQVTANPDTHLYPNYANYCKQHRLELVNIQRFSKHLMSLVQMTLAVKLDKQGDSKGNYVKGIVIGESNNLLRAAA